MRGTRNIISSEARTSLPLAAQMNDVEALPQMNLPSANDVSLRPMKLRFAQTELDRSLDALEAIFQELCPLKLFKNHVKIKQRKARSKKCNN